MVDLSKRMGIISAIVQQKPGLGKTAMMKYIFLLQNVYRVPLGYDFEIYTYGPYSSEVMEDIDFARHQEIIDIERMSYSTGHSGYNLSPSRNLANSVEKEREFISRYKESVAKVIELFGDKTAKDLELATTIIYLCGTYLKNCWPCNLDSISANVHEIKPHFNLETIKTEYRHLDGLSLLPISHERHVACS